jgi:hypothetical protein
MDPLQELLATDHWQTLEFFVEGLQDVSEAAVDREELLYNASLLAHYAQLSTNSVEDLSAPSDLGSVFDHFVLDQTAFRDGTLAETAGAQCLLLAGFFEDQMRQRYNIRWYAEMGAGFYHQASTHERSGRKAQLLGAIALRFELWRQRHARLSRELRDLPYLLFPQQPQ